MCTLYEYILRERETDRQTDRERQRERQRGIYRESESGDLIYVCIYLSIYPRGRLKHRSTEKFMTFCLLLISFHKRIHALLAGLYLKLPVGFACTHTHTHTHG